jgi:hypothetical protein
MENVFVFASHLSTTVIVRVVSLGKVCRDKRATTRERLGILLWRLDDCKSVPELFCDANPGK